VTQAIGTFDYIVVGAGSAGCVLANRLTASGRHRVLVLEAGPEDRNLWIHVPLGYGKLFKDRRHNWLYESEPQEHMDGRRIVQPRGKVLGGSSSINGLIYIRGQREDYDLWRQLGLAGWSYDDVLPYFRRAEDQCRGEDAYHGVGGPLSVAEVRDRHPLCDAFIAAAAQAGIPTTRDFNGPVQEGAGYIQMTARGGRRCSTARGYLRPARARPNLTVLTGALVTRLLFEGRRATGVTFRHEGALKQARAGAEVILSSGAFNSPQLLQLSGVGPADLLGAHGIPVVLDQPGVGADLQDHLQARMVWKCTRPVTVNDDMATLARRVRMGLAYVLARRGSLALAAGTACAFFKTDPRLATPDIQVHFITFSTDRMGETLHPFSGFTASVCQLRPESRGWVRIRSADPAQAPAIHPNYLATETDRRTMVDGLKILRAIHQKPAMTPFVAAEYDPGPACVSDGDFLAHVRARGTTIYHPSSTCRMGTDARAVTDERLRVRGLGGLRVVDASIMPAVVSGNTNAPVVMIAEKASAMILDDAGAPA